MITFNKTNVRCKFDSGDYTGSIVVLHPRLGSFVHPNCDDNFWIELEATLAVTVESFLQKHKSVNKRILEE